MPLSPDKIIKRGNIVDIDENKRVTILDDDCDLLTVKDVAAAVKELRKKICMRINHKDNGVYRCPTLYKKKEGFKFELCHHCKIIDAVFGEEAVKCNV